MAGHSGALPRVCSAVRQENGLVSGKLVNGEQVFHLRCNLAQVFKLQKLNGYLARGILAASNLLLVA
jgi:hypothetical protein